MHFQPCQVEVANEDERLKINILAFAFSAEKKKKVQRRGLGERPSEEDLFRRSLGVLQEGHQSKPAALWHCPGHGEEWEWPKLSDDTRSCVETAVMGTILPDPKKCDSSQEGAVRVCV